MFDSQPTKSEFILLTLISVLLSIPMILLMMDCTQSLRLIAGRPGFKCCSGQVSRVTYRRRQLR